MLKIFLIWFNRSRLIRYYSYKTAINIIMVLMLHVKTKMHLVIIFLHFLYFMRPCRKIVRINTIIIDIRITMHILPKYKIDTPSFRVFLRYRSVSISIPWFRKSTWNPLMIEMQGILRIITAQVETKKQRKIMNKSGIITTHGLTLNLLTSFFMILICVNKKRLEME